MAAIRLVITGRVQGVGFRAFVAGLAERRGLRGWVRNRRDGTVEALLIGDDEALAEAEAACARGPAFASVARIVRHAAEDDSGAGFRFLSTM
jgi:acylphosphatase